MFENEFCQKNRISPSRFFVKSQDVFFYPKNAKMCSWATNVGTKSRLAEVFAVCKLTDITLLFLAVRVAPQKEGSYFYPRKATFNSIPPFF